jgi:anti-sigma regulatory factor (Ser/Thr protein kinase)
MPDQDRDKPSPDVVFEFDHDESAASEARRALAPVVEPDAFAGDVNLVASELVSNAVRHTDDGGRLEAWDGDPFRVEVRDTSTDLPRTGPETITGGRGLRIVDTLSSRWGAEPLDDGKVVWAEFERPDRVKRDSGEPPITEETEATIRAGGEVVGTTIDDELLVEGPNSE